MEIAAEGVPVQQGGWKHDELPSVRQNGLYGEPWRERGGDRLGTYATAGIGVSRSVTIH